MVEDAHRYQANGGARMPPVPPDADARGRLKAARTKRLKRRLVPFEALDQEVVELIARLTPDDDKALGTNTARTILSAQTLRKELLLGRLKAEEMEHRLEESDVRAEFEGLKRELGIS